MEAVQRVERPMMDAMREEVGSETRLTDLLIALTLRAETAGVSARNKDPVSGVIGVQRGPL
jgi:hypothetical protein